MPNSLSDYNENAQQNLRVELKKCDRFRRKIGLIQIEFGRKRQGV